MKKSTIYFAILMAFATFGISCDEPDSTKDADALTSLLSLSAVSNINAGRVAASTLCNESNSITASTSLQSVPFGRVFGKLDSKVVATVAVGDTVTLTSTTTVLNSVFSMIITQHPYDYCNGEIILSGTDPFAKEASPTANSYTFTADYSGTFTLILSPDDGLSEITDVKVRIN